MIGSVEHAESGTRGWSRIWSREIDDELNVCGCVTFGTLEASVRYS